MDTVKLCGIGSKSLARNSGWRLLVGISGLVVFYLIQTEFEHSSNTERALFRRHYVHSLEYEELFLKNLNFSNNLLLVLICNFVFYSTEIIGLKMLEMFFNLIQNKLRVSTKLFRATRSNYCEANSDAI